MSVAFSRRYLGILFSFLIAFVAVGWGSGQERTYSAHIVEGGAALTKKLPVEIGDATARSVKVWLRYGADAAKSAPIVRVGQAEQHFELALENGNPVFAVGPVLLKGPQELSDGRWHQLVAVQSGNEIQLFVDGQVAASGQTPPAVLEPALLIAPRPGAGQGRFSGDLGAVTVFPRALTGEEIKRDFDNPVSFKDAMREENAKPWPLQTHQQAGYSAPQSIDRLPTGTPPAMPLAAPQKAAQPSLLKLDERNWNLAGGWKLLNSTELAPPASPEGARISQAGWPDGTWLPATVPGTVLTTLIDQGIFPDPDRGLNNLAIPESLNKHDWWFRTQFPTPLLPVGRRLELRFAGINYEAEVWFNGFRLGTIRGAFQRGVFDVTRLLRRGAENAVAVRISPPPHPGIPQEQSMKDGPGENGGQMVIDGPTFIATEGWDWIPAIRDRDTGLWQGVTLHEVGSIALGDLRVVTRLPLPDISQADLQIDVPVDNTTGGKVRVELGVAFEGTSFRTAFLVDPGTSTLHLAPERCRQLHLVKPRLWWPNGYGAAELYHLTVSASTAAGEQDSKAVVFGVRELSYETSLFDGKGRIRRVEATPQETLGKGYDAVDVHHAAMRQTVDGWASTMTPQAEGTPAIRNVQNEPDMTDLVLKVNGVRIAVRGGNWGMDDSRKRVGRERLEPYFRLHREANLNMIRNWVGQNTEESFFDLADEYGLLVWNDFWASTQNYNAEPGDLGLFIANARDVVRRDRNHASIAIWCGRNEGVPPPALNDALITMLTGRGRNALLLSKFKRHKSARQRTLLLGRPCLVFQQARTAASPSSLASRRFQRWNPFSSFIAPDDRWPVSDAWAYHDWHQASGGDTHTLMKHLAAQLGEPTSLQDFERKIQLFNYVDHQAIFEGFYQHLWAPNSGRMIWMTHPAWPSTMWQMYSADYDTQASFYAIKKANAPLHVQMDLSDGTVSVVNTTLERRPSLLVSAVAYSPDMIPLQQVEARLDAPANQITRAGQFSLPELFSKAPLAFVRLTVE